MQLKKNGHSYFGRNPDSQERSTHALNFDIFRQSKLCFSITIDSTFCIKVKHAFSISRTVFHLKFMEFLPNQQNFQEMLKMKRNAFVCFSFADFLQFHEDQLFLDFWSNQKTNQSSVF